MIVDRFDELFREVWYNSKMNLTEDGIEEIWNALREALKDQTERPDLEQYIDDVIEDRISKYLEEGSFGVIEEEIEEYEEE